MMALGGNKRVGRCASWIACAGALGMLATPAQAAMDVYGALVSGDAVITGDRINRNGTASTCGAAKPFPGTLPPSGLRYDQLGYTNTGPAQCVTFQVTGNCPGSGAMLTAYSGSLNPADVSVGYLGDSGASSNNNTVQSLSLDMAAGQSIQLVVSNGTAVEDCAYHVTSIEPLGTGTAAAVPSLGQWGLALTGLLAAGLGARRLRRRGA